VCPAWEAIASNVADDEEEEIVLEIPHAIDHRFFVRDAPKEILSTESNLRIEGSMVKNVRSKVVWLASGIHSILRAGIP
jgi:hypothetical protein